MFKGWVRQASAQMSDESEIANLEWKVVEAAMNWHHWHGYIPNLAPEHYEVALVKATRELYMARKRAEEREPTPIGSPN